MNTIKNSLSSIFSNSRRSSNASGCSDRDEPEPKSNHKKRNSEEKLVEEANTLDVQKVNYARRFSVPNASEGLTKENPAVEPECSYPIYVWPSFKRKKSKRRHSVAGQSDMLKQYTPSTLSTLLDEEEEVRPSFATLQAEDRERRPSLIMYQSEDPEHPDVVALQKLVDSLNFSTN